MKKIQTGILVAFLLFISVVPLYGKGKDDAPGQDKKGENVTVGHVDHVTDKTITVEDRNHGKKTEIEVDRTTKVMGDDKKSLKLSQIKRDDKIAVVNSDDDEASEGGKMKKAIKIFVKSASESAQLKRHAIQGIITNVTDSTLTLTHQTQRDRVYVIKFNPETLIKLKDTESSGSASLLIGLRAVVIGDINPDGTFTARYIHIIPGKAIGIFKKRPFNPGAPITGTPSASPTITGLLTPTPTTLETSPTPTL